MKIIEKHNEKRIQEVTSFLKWYRINSGFSQHELSEYSGVHKNTIVRYESNVATNLTLLTIFEVADTLELDISKIFLEIK